MGVSDFMKKMMFVRQFSSDNGKITVYDVRLVTLAFISLKEMQEEIISGLGKKGVGIIYNASKKGGYEMAKQLCTVMGLSGSKAVDLLMLGCRELTGWGSFELMDYKPAERKAIFHVTNGPFGEVPSKAENCHFTRGLVAGAMTYIFNSEVDAVETKCMAKGERFCEIVVQPCKDFSADSKLVKEQL